MTRVRSAFLMAAFVLFCMSPIAAAQAGGTILLVRHAEKVSDAPDAALSEVGKQRAEKLARMLSDAGISAIYTSEVQRTQQTAAPLAKQLKLALTVIPAKDVSGLVSKLKTLPSGRVVLVVGHSNTLPAIIEQLLSTIPDGNLRAGPATTMKDTDYDRLFIVSLNGNGAGVTAYGSDRPKLLLLHY